MAADQLHPADDSAGHDVQAGQDTAFLWSLLEVDPAPAPDQPVADRVPPVDAAGSTGNLPSVPEQPVAGQDDMHLLENLLTELPAPVPMPFLWHNQKRWFLTGGLVVLAALGLFVLYMLGSAAVSILTIRRNMQAMQLPPAPSVSALQSGLLNAKTPAATPTLILPPTEMPSMAARRYAASVPTVPFAPVDATAAALVPLLERTNDPALVITLTPLPPDYIAPAEMLPSLTLPPSAVSLSGQQSGDPGTDATRTRPRADSRAALKHTPSPDQPAVTVLVLGMDQRPGEEFPARTDAIIIAHAEPVSGRVALLSLPRDLIVPVAGVGSDRINAAYVYGEMNPHLGGGVAVARQTVSDLLGMPIDYVVLVNFEGFIGAIDAIGGVTVDVQSELYDPLYPTMDYGYTVAHFLPGAQHMDGTTALMYSRVRHMDSDFERMRRQQQVLVAVLQQLREQHPVRQLRTIATLTTALRDYIQTDLPQDQMIDLAWAFRDITPDAIERYTLNENMVSMFVSPDDPYAQFAVPGAIEDLSHQLLYGPSAGAEE